MQSAALSLPPDVSHDPIKQDHGIRSLDELPPRLAEDIDFLFDIALRVYPILWNCRTWSHAGLFFHRC